MPRGLPAFLTLFISSAIARADGGIVLRNATDHPLTIQLQAGQAVNVVDETAALGPLVPEEACAAPREATVTLAVGKTHVLPWGGRLRGFRPARDGGTCLDRVAVPAGRYLLRACDEADHACGLVAVTLPARDPIEVALAPTREEPARCDDVARVARVVHLAARLTHLDACAGVTPACGPVSEAQPLPRDGAACRALIIAGLDGFFVTLAPEAKNGTPVSAEAWTGNDAITAGRVEVGSSTWAVARDGKLRVAGSEGHHFHTHGGEPAHIANARLHVVNLTGAEVAARVSGVEWLTAVTCEGPLAAHGKPKLSSPARVTLPPGESELTVEFAAQPAYQAWCDRFAARISLEVGGDTLVVTSEQKVTRESP